MNSAQKAVRLALRKHPTKPSQDQARWLLTASPMTGVLSWVVGRKLVTSRVVRDCIESGWARASSSSEMSITDAGREALKKL